MLDPEVVEFLEQHDQVFLLTHRADGWPTGYPMVGTYRDEGIEFSTYRASAKVRRVLRDGAASCLVVPRDHRGDTTCIWLRGPAAIRERGAVPTARRRAAELDVPPDVASKVARRLDEGKRCVLRIEIRDTRWIARETGSG
jgi:pyridoxamine 5'-phosphate oxidase-like protein